MSAGLQAARPRAPAYPLTQRDEEPVVWREGQSLHCTMVVLAQLLEAATRDVPEVEVALGRSGAMARGGGQDLG